ncbi:anti-sigma factor family protein [Streptomyces poriticola]|uniref:anti-sigma factor family protein n=1 Tax=Streptomyces poriticola TaxID=3120506 RepID=UPI002FCE4867
MSGSRPTPEGHLAEQHLGDRLSALVDGELGHDARERVLAHVATCPKCKAEVDAQRRLKNVFAEAAPPAPSESFLARLQGLPAGGGTDGRPPLGGGGLPDGLSGLPGAAGRFGDTGAFGVKGGEPFEFDYVPSRPHTPLLPADERNHGFRIHDVGRPDAERSASRGLRLAFVVGGAVSLAAIALGGVTVGTPDTTTEARGGSGSGSNVTPMRTQGTAAATVPESQRRRSAAPLLGQVQGGQRMLGDTPVAPSSLSAPLLPGLSAAPAGGGQQSVRGPQTPMMAGAAALSPLIRPLDIRPPGLLAEPSPTTSPSPASGRVP